MTTAHCGLLEGKACSNHSLPHHLLILFVNIAHQWWCFGWQFFSFISTISYILFNQKSHNDVSTPSSISFCCLFGFHFFFLARCYCGCLFHIIFQLASELCKRVQYFVVVVARALSSFAWIVLLYPLDICTKQEHFIGTICKWYNCDLLWWRVKRHNCFQCPYGFWFGYSLQCIYSLTVLCNVCRMHLIRTIEPTNMPQWALMHFSHITKLHISFWSLNADCRLQTANDCSILLT